MKNYIQVIPFDQPIQVAHPVGVPCICFCVREPMICGFLPLRRGECNNSEVPLKHPFP